MCALLHCIFADLGNVCIFVFVPMVCDSGHAFLPWEALCARAMRQLAARRGGGSVAAAAASASAAAAAATGAPPPGAAPTALAVAAVARKLIASLELILELPGVELSSKLLPAAAGLARLPADGTPFPGGARVYLPELHSAERSVASALARLAAAPPRPASARGPKDLQAWLDAASAQLQVTLSDDQRAAVAAAAQERVLILTGGPGTGKTFVVTLAVRLWMQQGLRVRRARGCCVLCAVCARVC
jgi:hypothetical protein